MDNTKKLSMSTDNNAVGHLYGQADTVCVYAVGLTEPGATG